VERRFTTESKWLLNIQCARRIAQLDEEIGTRWGGGVKKELARLVTLRIACGSRRRDVFIRSRGSARRLSSPARSAAYPFRLACPAELNYPRRGNRWGRSCVSYRSRNRGPPAAPIGDPPLARLSPPIHGGGVGGGEAEGLGDEERAALIRSYIGARAYLIILSYLIGKRNECVSRILLLVYHSDRAAESSRRGEG